MKPRTKSINFKFYNGKMMILKREGMTTRYTLIMQLPNGLTIQDGVHSSGTSHSMEGKDVGLLNACRCIKDRIVLHDPNTIPLVGVV